MAPRAHSDTATPSHLDPYLGGRQPNRQCCGLPVSLRALAADPFLTTLSLLRAVNRSDRVGETRAREPAPSSAGDCCSKPHAGNRSSLGQGRARASPESPETQVTPKGYCACLELIWGARAEKCALQAASDNGRTRRDASTTGAAPGRFVKATGRRGAVAPKGGVRLRWRRAWPNSAPVAVLALRTARSGKPRWAWRC